MRLGVTFPNFLSTEDQQNLVPIARTADRLRSWLLGGTLIADLRQRPCGHPGGEEARGRTRLPFRSRRAFRFRGNLLLSPRLPNDNQWTLPGKPSLGTDFPLSAGPQPWLLLRGLPRRPCVVEEAPLRVQELAGQSP